MHPPTHWTPKNLLDWSEGYFREKGISTPRLDGELLLAHVLACRRIDLYLQFDRPLNAEELDAYRNLVRARAGRTPVAYLLGEAGFHNLLLAVGPGCLVPRPDTETLVEVALEALAALREHAGPAGALTVLDWGTGSGAIPLALLSEGEGLACIGCESSLEALAYAEKNRRRHGNLLTPRGNSLKLVASRGFDALSSKLRAHLIVANPPYIPTDEIDGLEPEVARAEPRAALDGGADGLAPYPELFTFAARALRGGGRLILEFGAGQGAALREMVAAHPPLRLVEVRKDLGGHERVLHVERPPQPG